MPRGLPGGGGMGGFVIDRYITKFEAAKTGSGVGFLRLRCVAVTTITPTWVRAWQLGRFKGHRSALVSKKFDSIFRFFFYTLACLLWYLTNAWAFIPLNRQFLCSERATIKIKQASNNAASGEEIELHVSKRKLRLLEGLQASIRTVVALYFIF